jgi:hypothetical protein
MKKKQQQPASKACRLCGRRATVDGEFKPSAKQRRRWPFSPIDCSLCTRCNRLPDVGARLGNVFGFCKRLGRVQ